jgi:hypothetical protein
MFQEKSTQSRLQELRFNRKQTNVAFKSNVSTEIRQISISGVIFQEKSSKFRFQELCFNINTPDTYFRNNVSAKTRLLSVKSS